MASFAIDNDENDNTNSVLRVAIIGAGISGPLLAQSLQNYYGFVDVDIFDRDESPTSRFQGWCLGLLDQSLVALFDSNDKNSVLKRFVLGKDNEKNVYQGFEMRSHKNAVLMSGASSGRYLDRGGLRKALINGIDVHWSHKFVSVEKKDANVLLTFKGPQGKVVTHECDIVVAADGANSMVRKQIIPSITYDDLGITTIAGIAEFDVMSESTKSMLIQQNLVRWIGPLGMTFMMFSYHENTPEGFNPPHVLWVLSFPGQKTEWDQRFANGSANIHDEYSLSLESRKELLEFCLAKVNGHFPSAVTEAIKNTSADRRLFGPRQVYSISPIKLEGIFQYTKQPGVNQRVVFIGDAAHATTTHRGLGANTAIADAMALSKFIKRMAGELGAARHANQSERIDEIIKNTIMRFNLNMVNHAAMVVSESLQSTQMIHDHHWTTPFVRPLLLRFFDQFIPKRNVTFRFKNGSDNNGSVSGTILQVMANACFSASIGLGCYVILNGKNAN